LGEKCCTAKLAPKWLVEHGTISLDEWLELHGPITRPGRCIPCEGSEPAPDAGKGVVLFWVGDYRNMVEQNGEWLPGSPSPHWQHVRYEIIQVVWTAIGDLKAKGYDAKFVGGEEAALSSAAKRPNLVALWAGAHGSCSGALENVFYCGLWTTDDGAFIASSGPAPTGVKNEWHHMSPQVKYLYVYHCYDKHGYPTQVQAQQLYAKVTGLSPGKIELCKAGSDGLCYPRQYMDSIRELARRLR